MALLPSLPVIVSAAMRALMIASSVACTVASNKGSSSLFESMVTSTRLGDFVTLKFIVEKAMKMSPEKLLAMLPTLPSPSEARRAIRLSW